jgi:hypothetical protein
MSTLHWKSETPSRKSRERSAGLQRPRAQSLTALSRGKSSSGRGRRGTGGRALWTGLSGRSIPVQRELPSFQRRVTGPRSVTTRFRAVACLIMELVIFNVISVIPKGSESKVGEHEIHVEKKPAGPSLEGCHRDQQKCLNVSALKT